VTPRIAPEDLDTYLRSHLINPSLIRADDFTAFMQDRQQRLLALIEQATGKAAYKGDGSADSPEAENDEGTAEAELTMTAA